MKLLTVAALLCAMMVLTMAVANSHLVKRSNGCPYRWTRHSDRCFYYVPTTMSWARAERNCLSMGANLASVHSIREYQKIQRLTAHYGYPQIWIGGTDAPQEGIWLWSDGTSFHYSHWCPGEPNNDRNQHCIQMNYGDSKCWDDLRCDAHLPSSTYTEDYKHSATQLDTCAVVIVVHIT
ncbi:type-2 ice-structuring protein-like [Astatotilapia calliptera]|uniref:type-2 ice-structuring protein-like n=1 Tax=Astatotilapia calliptera TaxID=8154 RepID=UPI000E4195C3|nr:type-2 ice-structuring protein-like [Astatotilapia calliptera]